MIPFRFGVVILGAGASSRMGQPKLLLPWGTTTVIGHLLAQWKRLDAEQAGVVCAADHQAMHTELNHLNFPQENRIPNPDPMRGMFSSIQCAARWPGWRAGLSHWAVALGDQPHLKEATLKAVLDFTTAHPEKICQPVWQNRRRHPVVFPAKAFTELGLTNESDLKTFLDARNQERAFCDIDDPGLGIDLDTPMDYERAVASFSPR